jgi:hypothetical protein
VADLYASDARGVYIPQYFAQSVNRNLVIGVEPEDYQTLEAGPDAPYYWDTWQHVCDHASISNPKGGPHGYLYQSGDLWIIWGDSDPDASNLCPDL